MYTDDVLQDFTGMKLMFSCFCWLTALGGINFKELLDDAALEEGGKQLLDFKDTMGDRIQVFLE